MKLFRVTTNTGETFLIWAISEGAARNQAHMRARTIHDDFNKQTFKPQQFNADGSLLVDIDKYVVQKDWEAIDAISIDDRFLNPNDMQGEAIKVLENSAQVTKLKSLVKDPTVTLDKLLDWTGSGEVAKVDSGAGAGAGDPTALTQRQVDDPMIGEQIRPSVAWERAMDEVGLGKTKYGTGIMRSVHQPYRSALGALADIGMAGNLQTGPWANLGEGRERQDFLTNALRLMSGGMIGGTGTQWSPVQASRSLWEQMNPAHEFMQPFTDPEWWTDPAAVKNAETLAELALSGFGRGRYGALGGYLPSAKQMVSDYGSQAAGSGQADLKQYLYDRLNPAGSATFGPVSGRVS